MRQPNNLPADKRRTKTRMFAYENADTSGILYV
jgi:hypothetical protein